MNEDREERTFDGKNEEERTFNITAKSLTGKQVSLLVRGDDSVEDLRVRAVEALGVMGSNVKLVMNRSVMEDGKRLSHYNVQEGCVVHCIMRLLCTADYPMVSPSGRDERAVLSTQRVAGLVREIVRAQCVDEFAWARDEDDGVLGNLWSGPIKNTRDFVNIFRPDLRLLRH